MHNRLLMYDSLRCSFLSIKKPPKVPNCVVCGDVPTILSMEDSRTVSEPARGPDGIVENGRRLSLIVKPVIPAEVNVSCEEYQRIRENGEPHVLLDVRVERQYEMCSLEGAVNIPLQRLPEELGRIENLSEGRIPVFCICRRGIFSAEATRILSKASSKTHPNIHAVRNVAGGLTAWSVECDPSFPVY